MDIETKRRNRPHLEGGKERLSGIVDLRTLADEKKYTGGPASAIQETRKIQRSCSDIKMPAAPYAYVDATKRDDIVSEEQAAESAPLFAQRREKAASFNFIRELETEKREMEKMPALKRALKKSTRDKRVPRPEIVSVTTHTSERRAMLRFAMSCFLIPVIIFTFSFAQLQLEKGGRVLGESTAAYDSLRNAAGYAFAADFASTGENFASANLSFARARETINSIGSGIGETVANLPLDTPLSTAQNLASAGENISLAGKDLSDMLEKTSQNPDPALLGKIQGTEENLRSAADHLKGASDNLSKVDTRYIPEDMRAKIEMAKDTLPGVSNNFQKLVEDYPLISKMLGSEKPQKYLLLFENNSEMRATGGFIGTYGILDIEDGQMKNLVIDGIFNPDGQLKEKIVPPMPIQKISSSWSMHDANWFADYPTSAKKVALMYEKTGGPTVDGVISITPETVKKLLAITGPIEMPEYGVTITADNFVAETQNQVESLYDKQENRPKKILSALAPILIEKAFACESDNTEEKTAKLLRLIQTAEESLQEKHILIYHRDEDIENMLQKRGWGGEVIQNERGDYLSVINSNVNGYKTDAVIDESIDLKTEIREDGRIIDTLTVTRKHNGGNDTYDWYNRVNADYMRVYVPKGSILLEASGNTVEEYVPPMDYTGFKVDSDVEAIEKTIRIDPQSGTQVFEEAGKTVFGNWVYVSPQEEVRLVYKYELPWRVDFAAGSKETDAFTSIIQKQSGSTGSAFTSSISFPEDWESVWKTSKVREGNTITEKLTRDMLYAIVFVKR